MSNTSEQQFLNEEGMTKLVNEVALKISESYVLKSKYEADVAALKARIEALEKQQ